LAIRHSPNLCNAKEMGEWADNHAILPQFFLLAGAIFFLQ
jgi:hypothetical protein